MTLHISSPNDYPAVRLDQPEYKEDEQDKQNTLKSRLLQTQV